MPRKRSLLGIAPLRRTRTRGGRAARKAAELSIAAPQVIAIRTARMLAAGPQPDARDRREFVRMGAEKVEAFSEAFTAMSAQMVEVQQEMALLAMNQWWNAWTAPWQALGAPRAGDTSGQRLRASMNRVLEEGLTPLHKRATANARRLGRARKK